MKKQIIIAIALSVSAFSFSQKKELKAADKAITGKNYAEAKAALKEVEPLLSTMDDKYKAQYYYLNASALYAGGAGSMNDIDAALKSLENVKGDYVSESSELKQTMVNGLLTKGNKFYESKDFANSSKYFEKAYRLSTKDTLFLYYAAATAINVQDYDRALTIYEELKNLGYTGIEKQYFATNVESGEEEVLDKATRDLYVKAKSHNNPGERITESKKPEIVRNIALIYVDKGDNDKAITAIKEAREENPEDINLILSEANIYYKTGKIEEFKGLLEKATQMDPNNPELQYNLGVISADSGHPEEARAYYEKTISLDPEYINAYINLSALILSKEEPIIKEMNGLGSSKKDDLRYDELREQRLDLYKQAVPYLTKALEIDGKNISAAKTLANIYSILGEKAKHDEMKAKADALEAEN
ncbi:tetratricopeptide repeat protein [Mariniflexile fucanivorans]|uniref:Tetratricopeptide repeat protein n=1 Tax=Mariniflexile fucanivorans TaxID=264023 RepID=A0A4R1RDV0_9FLAO|nr:tetratricopeptide repeat protein [Mariniflexile fucanivorans]TCL64033.1 tetratricopeptide repeat protein [Mariniflexile fucanivorans]